MFPPITLTISTSPVALRASRMNLDHVDISEDPSVLGFPTTSFLIALAATPSTFVPLLPGVLATIISGARSWAANEIIGYLKLPAGETRFIQQESDEAYDHSSAPRLVIFDQSVVQAVTSMMATSATATKPANTVHAGPASGAPAPPTYRGLVLADLPNPLDVGTF